MSYLREPAETHQVAALYAAEERGQGYVANFTKVFAHRPEVYAAWKTLSAAVQANMTLERYEVATIAAAQQRGSAYCGLAHARNLAQELGVETVTQIATGEDDEDMGGVEEEGDDEGEGKMEDIFGEGGGDGEDDVMKED